MSNWKDLTAAQASLLAAAIAIVPAGISGVVSGVVSYKSSVAALKQELDPLSQAQKRIIAQLPDRVGYSKHVYPNLGIGMSVPSSWTTEDYAARFAGGEFDLVKRYEDTKGIVGIKFRYRGIQKNYINDINAEINNQKEVWVKIDPKIALEDTTINGKPAKLWKYTQSTGKRFGDIRWYWVRLIPEVKLEIICFVYKDSHDNEEFWREVDGIIGSLVIDEATVGLGKARLYESKI